MLFGKLDHKNVTDSRKIWKKSQFFIQDKAFYKENVILNSNSKTISSNEEIVEFFG